MCEGDKGLLQTQMHPGCMMDDKGTASKSQSCWKVYKMGCEPRGQHAEVWGPVSSKMLSELEWPGLTTQTRKLLDWVVQG